MSRLLYGYRLKSVIIFCGVSALCVAMVNILLDSAVFVLHRRGPGFKNPHLASYDTLDALKWDPPTFEGHVEELFQRLSHKYSTTAVRRYRADENTKTHTYEVNGKPILWIYWEGPPKPAYIELCILTAVCHNYEHFDIRVLNDTEFIKSVGWTHPAFKHLSLNHKSDYFRMAVLHHYGGVYVDADTIIFKSLRSLYEQLTEYDIVGPSARDGALHFSNIGPIRANTTFSGVWRSRLLEKMDEKFKSGQVRGDPFKWVEVGGGLAVPIFEELLRRNGIKHYGFSGPESWLQFEADDVLSEERDLLSEFKETEMVVLNNRFFPYMYRRLTRRGVLRSKKGVSQLLRYSLIRCLKKMSLDSHLPQA